MKPRLNTLMEASHFTGTSQIVQGHIIWQGYGIIVFWTAKMFR